MVAMIRVNIEKILDHWQGLKSKFAKFFAKAPKWQVRGGSGKRPLFAMKCKGRLERGGDFP
jgi:hypothetical protein